MDIKEYIASGALESYVTGLASEQERREVECLTSIYPELKAELDRLQSALEQYSKSIAVQPPASSKTNIMETIKGVPQETPLQNDSTATSVHRMPTPENLKPSLLKAPSKISYWKYATAACVLLLISLGYFLNRQQQAYDDLQANYLDFQTETQTQFIQLQNALAQNKEERDLLLDEATQTIALKGTELSPESQVRLYWNADKQAFVYVADQLPEPEPDKQYQLWAIVDGAPVDMGLLNQAGQLTDLKKVPEGSLQAFAITLEKKGGSQVPTLEAMYVMGGV